MLQAGGLITITLSDRVQLSRCFAREFSHAKVTLLPESRRDRYRTYELDKTVLRVIVVILFLSQISECDVGIFPCHINNIRRIV